MNISKYTLALALGAALAVPAAAQAVSGSNFNYAYINFVMVDVDYSQRFIDMQGNEVGRLESDSDSGFEIAGSWEFYEGFHLFGLYHTADQELEARGILEINPLSTPSVTQKGSFELNRYRVGLGYAYPISPEFDLYGRVTYDNAEIASVKLGDLRLGDIDDSGVGAEVGAVYTLSPQFQFVGNARYTSVGELSSKTNSDDDLVAEFDSDFLFGLGARWYITERFGLQVGYETGTWTTLNLGGRMRF